MKRFNLVLLKLIYCLSFAEIEAEHWDFVARESKYP